MSVESSFNQFLSLCNTINTMRKSDRLFQLTNILRLRQPITAQQLADELNVCIRTIYRYIDDLSLNGIPIYGEAGVGYRLDENFNLPPLNLTVDEMDALLIGMKMVAGWTGSELPHAAHSLLQKIKIVLPEYKKELNPDLFHVPQMYFQNKYPNNWDQLRHCVKQHKIITINYCDEKNRQTQREIYPLGLFYWGAKWTLGAWCTIRFAFRNFRTDRIKKINISGDHFELTDEINLGNYIKNQMQANE